MASSPPVTLYDLREDYPRQRGDIFRSRQIAECPVCHALTNKVVMGGSPGYGVRMICPNSTAEWHHELEDKCTLLSSAPHPKSYCEELSAEIAALHDAHRAEQKNDLEGEVDLTDQSLRRWVTNPRSYAPSSPPQTRAEIVADLRRRFS